jgi:hypothetical protein
MRVLNRRSGTHFDERKATEQTPPAGQPFMKIAEFHQIARLDAGKDGFRSRANET